jgi:segregation and condensation protein A
MTAADDPARTRRRPLGRGAAAPRTADPEPASLPEPAPEPVAEPVASVAPAAEAPAPAHAPQPPAPPESPAPVGSSQPSARQRPEPAVEPEPEPAAGQEPEHEREPSAEPAVGPESEPEHEPGREAERPADDGRFTVRLKNFEGPFDLLLQLISKHKLDVTEVALSKVTDEFIAHIHAMGPDWDLDQATEFLVVAATLLDLKAARLLPAAEVEDEEDLALLEARDLLFARLLQYRAYKRIAAIFAERLEAESAYHPRTVGLEPHHAELLPEVVIHIGPEGFAKLAVKAMQPKPRPQVYVDHIHAPLVSVREQAEIVIGLLRATGGATFAELTADAADTLTVVARFLALLELYREKAVALDQEEALGALLVRWTGGVMESAAPLVTDEFDQETAPRDRRKDGHHDAADTAGAAAG